MCISLCKLNNVYQLIKTIEQHDKYISKNTKFKSYSIEILTDIFTISNNQENGAKNINVLFVCVNSFDEEIHCFVIHLTRFEIVILLSVKHFVETMTYSSIQSLLTFMFRSESVNKFYERLVLINFKQKRMSLLK